MAQEAVNIKVVVAAGVSAPEAIKAALPVRLAEFARLHGFQKSNVTMCIYGQARYERIRAALASALQVEREWLDELLDAQRPAPQGAAA